ncbi:hypothetical protein ABW19_dt0206280 [Dactylella cylindrospora]|nr:hypothetical protein ABW19_dt0206280 [Dactylella cylindrospora]
MKPSTLVLPIALTISSVSAGLERFTQIQYLLPIVPTAKQDIVLTPGAVHDVDITNYKDLLQDTNVDWLLAFTTSPDSCPGCVVYEQTFNETVALLQDQSTTYFARVSCDTQALLCSIFSSWGARIYHVTHSDVPSTSFPGLTVHKTHLHTVPFHRPGTEPPQEYDEKGNKIKSPPPPPDAKWIAEVIKEEKWRGFEEWDDNTQPFDGSLKELLAFWWWFVNLFSGIPPIAMMVGISLLSRFVTGRFSGRAAAPRPREQQAAAQAAKKNK